MSERLRLWEVFVKIVAKSQSVSLGMKHWKEEALEVGFKDIMFQDPSELAENQEKAR